MMWMGGGSLFEPECSKLQYFRQKQEDKASKALFLRWGTPPPPLFTLFNTDLIQVIKLTRASPLFLHTARDQNWREGRPPNEATLHANQAVTLYHRLKILLQDAHILT